MAARSILLAQVGHAVGLQRLGTGLVRRVVGLLNRTDADLESRIRQRLDGVERGSIENDRTLARLESLRETLASIHGAAYDEIRSVLDAEGRGLAAYEAQYQRELISRALSRRDLSGPDAAQLTAIVTRRPFQGRLLRDWVSGVEEGRGAKVMDAIRIGMVQGETVDQIVKRVRGTKAMAFKDGVLEISRRDAEAVVRTAVTHIASGASEAFYAANPDLVRGVRWCSILDSRTTVVCASRDGKVYDVGKGPRPPAHWRCRSFTSPVLRGEDDEGGDRISYAAWLKAQPVEVQNDVLGVTKARLFRSGGLTLDRFVDRAGAEYTLDELRRREKAAFDLTGA